MVVVHHPMNVHLVDGTFELFRAFFGSPSARTAAGVEVGATRGFLRSMWALLHEPGVTHVAVAFDTVIESFRNQLFAGYKTGEGIEPALWSQAPLVERAARALGMVTWSMIEFEADDAIATAAARFAADPAVDQVLILSPDKDFAQCVTGQRVVGIDRIRKTRMDEARVVEKFGVPPASIPDWLALVGDTADGIPGLQRWGARSASTILARWQHLEAIPDEERFWDVPLRGAAALAQVLASHRQEALLYRTLATLRRDVPLPEGLGELAWRGVRPDELAALCGELEDPSFLERVHKTAGAPGASKA
jgi:5'-3' exonuclease